MIWTLLIFPPDGDGGSPLAFPRHWHTRMECVAQSVLSHQVRANDTMCIGREGKLLNAQATQLNPSEDDTTDVHHVR